MVAFATGINDASITSKIDETCNHKKIDRHNTVNILCKL